MSSCGGHIDITVMQRTQLYTVPIEFGETAANKRITHLRLVIEELHLTEFLKMCLEMSGFVFVFL